MAIGDAAVDAMASDWAVGVIDAVADVVGLLGDGAGGAITGSSTERRA